MTTVTTPPPAPDYWWDLLVPSVGSVWCWEPLKPHAREDVTVTAVEWNGEEWWVTTSSKSGECKNDLGRFAEACVLVTPAP